MANEMIARLPLDQLGGARIFRPCTILGVYRRAGETIDAETLRKIPRANLRSMIDQRYLVIWPATAEMDFASDDEVFVYNRLGTSTYDVVVGRRIAEGATKEEAHRLAEENRRSEAKTAA